MFQLTPANILDTFASSFQLVRSSPALVELGKAVPVEVLPPSYDATVPAVSVPAAGLSTLEQLPVTVEVDWKVYDADGTTEITNDDTKVIVDVPTGASVQNQPIPQQATFLFAPLAFTELTNSDPVPAPAKRIIRATITLSVTLDVGPPVKSAPYTLPDVAVFVPAIPIPTVLALFRHTDYSPFTLEDIPHWDTRAGAMVLVVPANSPLRSIGQVLQAVNALIGTVSSLVQIPQMPLLLLGLQALVGAVPVQPHVAFIAADEIELMERIFLIDVETPGIGGTPLPIPGTDTARHNVKAQDQMSSLIFIGPGPKQRRVWNPKTKKVGTQTVRRVVRCYNNKHMNDNTGKFTVALDTTLFALVSSFKANLSNAPSSIPSGAITVNRLNTQTGNATFDNVLSSLQFGWEPVPAKKGGPPVGRKARAGQEKRMISPSTGRKLLPEVTKRGHHRLIVS